VASEGRKSSKSATPSAASTPKIGTDLSTTPPLGHGAPAPPLLKTSVDGRPDDTSFIGSPMKRQRASLAGTDEDSIKERLDITTAGAIGEVLGSTNERQGQSDSICDKGIPNFGGAIVKKETVDEEL
jgi:hypothetical protein